MATMFADAADASSWTVTGSFWVAFAGVVFGLAALIVSVVLGLRSARTAEEAARHARSAAEAAEVVARSERERDHERYYPVENGILQRTRERRLVFQFRLDRSYEIRAEGVRDEDTQALPVPAPEDEFYRIVITDPTRTHLLIRFWPPKPAADRAKPWECLCGRPTDPDEGTAHWDWLVRLDMPGGESRPAHIV